MSNNSKPEPRGRGRPAGLEGLDIDRTIAELFLQGGSPGFIIQKTGFDKNTVYPRYKALLAIAKEQEEQDFRERHELEKIQYVISLDDLIYRTYQVLSYVEGRIQKYAKKNVDVPDSMLQKFSDLTKNIMSMKKERVEKSMKLPLDEDLKNKINEEVEKHGK